ncbi:MAG: Endonuclease III [Elusimicrobia bacterium]|nr:Endonuclease III [Elusimicrobiota bacterium]
MFRKNKDVRSLLKNLKTFYPRPECALHHRTPLELLVATILSAQCTDERVNKVTPALFKKYRTASDYAHSDPTELEGLIRSTGFYRNKAKSIRGMAKLVDEKFGGKIPQTMDELLTLPGVARKTANVTLGVVFKKAEGVVVDTHVSRLSQRLGLSNKTSAEKIEKDLMGQIPKESWIWFSHALIHHGRKICKARNPLCGECPIRKNCPNPALV